MADTTALAAALAQQALPAQQENQFQQDLFMAPGWRDWRRDFMRTQGGPPNVEPGGDYNYRLAWLLGAQPQLDQASGTFHGLSSAEASPYAKPFSLKSPNHPTAWMEGFMQKFGQDPNMLGPNDWNPEKAAVVYQNTKGRR